jgi:molybdopterin-guanine dinucleotide biosynthesis protein MobB
MIPILAIAAWSGTGKTTLLKALIPALCARGLRPGLIKFSVWHPVRHKYAKEEPERAR